MLVLAVASDLSVKVTQEGLVLADKVGSPFEPRHGVVAILDALGARDYSLRQVNTFLESRKLVLQAAQTLAEKYLKRFNVRRLKRFAFQDTVIICYVLDDRTSNCIADFCQISPKISPKNRQVG